MTSVIYPLSTELTAKKLLNALDCLLIEHFTIQDKTLLEKLLTSLQNADDLLKTIPMSTYCIWFSSVLDICREHTLLFKKSSIHLYAFALKFLAILVKSHDGFVALTESCTLQSLVGLLDVASNLKESSIFNAYMSLLLILNTHKMGLEYVFQEGLWKNILLAIRGLIVPAKYIEIQSSQYFADLILKSFEHEMSNYCEPLLQEIFDSLDSTHCLIINQQVKDFFAYNVYVKTLILSLEKFIGTKYESDVCQKIINQYSLATVLVNIQKLLNVAPNLFMNYIKLHLLFDCFTLWNNSEVETILKSIFSHTNMAKNIQSSKQINYVYVQAIRYANISNTQLTVNTEFEKELIIGQLIPLKRCTEWLTFSKCEKSKFDRSCNIEPKYIFNHCNDYNSKLNEVAISSVLNILDIVPILKQESLNYLVNFFSTLTDQFLCSDNWLEQHQNISIYDKFLEILSYVFICWTKILECKLYITENVSNDSLLVPLVHVHSQFFDKLCYNYTLLQNGLKLISIALNKRIHECERLTDNLTAFSKLCTTLNNLMLDTRPEIRDSCLQCISSLVMAAQYNSGHLLVKLVLEKKLPIAVLNNFKHDNDVFVRAKALECLEQMVSVLDIWEASLKDSDLIAYCLNLMQYESEGIIRRQIVKFITAVFIYNKLSYLLFHEICVVMVHISIKDPLWEVKTFTYEFWDSVIQKFFGKSCNVINTDTVKLNENLVKLNETGCLHVLHVALKEEHDLVVQKKAIGLTRKLLSFISSSNKSDIIKLHCKSLNHLSYVDDAQNNCIDNKQKKSRQIDSSDRIINSITSTNDCELLPSLKSANSSNIYPIDMCINKKTDVYISLNDFLDFTSTYDFSDCDVKKQWVIFTRSGLDSMLDDIIHQSQNTFVDGADHLDCH